MWKFYGKQVPLKAVVKGEHRFGTWANHAKAWHPWDRPNTLLLRYEDMVTDLPKTLSSVGEFLNRPATRSTIPDRDTIAGADGRWVRSREKSEPVFTDEILAEFERANAEVSKLFGYAG